VIKTAIIIVSWNGKKYLKDCFDSLKAQSKKDFKVIFVDNGSEDGSADFVRENYLETEFLNLDIIRLEKNTGFSFGYNKGIKRALEDENINYIVVLNNDTKLDEKFVEKMVDCAERNPDAGSIQPKVVNFFEKGKIDCAGIYISRDGTAHNRGYGKDAEKYGEEKEIFGANGTASLFTRKALERTQFKKGEYFDNDYFAFYEDVDLAWRIRKIGLKSYYCPNAVVWHIHSGTAGKASLLKAYYLHRNYFFTVFKNYPCRKLAKTLFWRFMSYIQLILNAFQKKKREAEFVKGYGKGRVAATILSAWVSVILNLLGLFGKRKFINMLEVKNYKKTKTTFIFLFFLFMVPRICSAFTVAHISDIHASNKKTRVAESGKNILSPRMYIKCLREVRNLNVDLVIATGDITNTGQRSYYKKVVKRTKGMEVVWVKGNHDDNDFNKILKLNDFYYIEKENWRVIVLYSSVSDKKNIGGLDTAQINFLKTSQDTEKNIIVAMHHPIFDENILEPLEKYTDFREALGPNVKYVLSGHWHSNFEMDLDNIHYQTQEALSQNSACHYKIINLD
jgi:GT2 family glycosyltransferase/predicted phosphodiesterase